MIQNSQLQFRGKRTKIVILSREGYVQYNIIKG